MGKKKGKKKFIETGSATTQSAPNSEKNDFPTMDQIQPGLSNPNKNSTRGILNQITSIDAQATSAPPPARNRGWEKPPKKLFSVEAQEFKPANQSSINAEKLGDEAFSGKTESAPNDLKQTISPPDLQQLNIKFKNYLPKDINNIIFTILRKFPNEEIYFHGGTSRDFLLNYDQETISQPSDYDLLIRYQKLNKLNTLFSKNYKEVIGTTHPIVRIYSFNNLQLDFGALSRIPEDPNINRSEVTLSNGNTSIYYAAEDPTDDSYTGDLTINKIYIFAYFDSKGDVQYGFCDPLNGYADLINKVLRIPNLPSHSVDDKLKQFPSIYLRALLFKARYPDFNFEKNTEEALRKNLEVLTVSTLDSNHLFQILTSFFTRGVKTAQEACKVLSDYSVFNQVFNKDIDQAMQDSLEKLAITIQNPTNTDTTLFLATVMLPDLIKSFKPEEHLKPIEAFHNMLIDKINSQRQITKISEFHSNHIQITGLMYLYQIYPSYQGSIANSLSTISFRPNMQEQVIDLTIKFCQVQSKEKIPNNLFGFMKQRFENLIWNTYFEKQSTFVYFNNGKKENESLKSPTSTTDNQNYSNS